MMVSHFLKAVEREQLRNEIARVLKPGGWLFFKSFLADEDLHTKRLLREHPADEPGAYIHPEFGAYEYVYSEAAMEEFFSSHFDIKKIERSHRHLNRGRAGPARPGKRRTIVAYMQTLN
jgi:ubiquinone/menaquinone biosynthesis C-methylase UbiE